jgi:hypothetical protein
MSVTSSVYFRSCFVDFGVDGESRCVNGLFANYDFSVFVDKDKVAHADLGEVSRKRVEPWWTILEYNVCCLISKARLPSVDVLTHLSTGERTLTEMIGQNWVANTDVTSYTLVKASLGKYPVSRREMLFAIQTLILGVVEHGV